MVDVAALHALIDQSEGGPRPLVLLDVRWALDGSKGEHDHLAGHLPGAVYVDLGTELAAPAWRRVAAQTAFETRMILRNGEQLLVTTVAYLTPIPGSGRRRALLLTLVLLRGADVPPDDPPLLQMKALFDLCVSTLTWLPRH